MTAEQSALLRKVEESLEAARLLLGEDYFDFAVSRAYFSMFYNAEALLLSEGLTFSKHSAVIAKFGEHFAKSGKAPAEYHRYLIEASDSRNVGDYDIGPGLTNEQAAEQIARAETFLDFGKNQIS